MKRKLKGDVLEVELIDLDWEKNVKDYFQLSDLSNSGWHHCIVLRKKALDARFLKENKIPVINMLGVCKWAILPNN